MRRAATLNLPPSQYLGLPWERWGETDCMLDRAVSEHDRRMCSCGCGHWLSETHGLDADGDPHDSAEWTVVDDPCMARAALDIYLADQKERTPGQMLYTRPATDEDD